LLTIVSHLHLWWLTAVAGWKKVSQPMYQATKKREV
jgi:hypothetical protein